MGRRKLRLYRRMRAVALNITEKSADRVILDCLLTSNSVNATDFVVEQKKNKSLVRTRTPQYRRRGTGK